MSAPEPSPDRRVALWTFAVGAVAFLGLAAVLVPWNVVPGGDVTAVAIAVASWFGFTNRGRRLVERLPGRWWLRTPLAVAALILIGRLVTLPAAVALQRLRLDDGLSAQPWRGWTVDLVKGELLTIVVTALGLLVLIGCARRWIRAWPAVVGGLLAAFVVLGSSVYPVVVEPLFNHFEPLPDGQLRTQIFAMADREGVPIGDVLVADASRRTTALNAYVSGFGSTRRVVVYDNLVDSVPQDETLSVVAHELGHAKHGDVLIGMALGTAASLLGVALLALAVGAMRRRGHPVIREAAVVPLVLALAAIGQLAALPVQNVISRQIETRADMAALRTTKDPDAFVAVQKELALRSLTDPTPPALSQFWFGSHPTVLQRAHSVLGYFPEAGAVPSDSGSDCDQVPVLDARHTSLMDERGASGVGASGFQSHIELRSQGVAQVPSAVAVPPFAIELQVSLNIPEIESLKANTTATMTAAIPAMRRPYSTAEAPCSSILAARARS